MFGVYVDKSGFINGTLYLPNASHFEVSGTLDKVKVSKVSQEVPLPVKPGDCDFVLAHLVEDGNAISIRPLPCKPQPLFDHNGPVIAADARWVVLTHPSGKVWAYNENDPKSVLFKNDHTGNCFVLNTLKSNPAVKQDEKLKNQYEVNPGRYTFSVSAHRFLSIN